MQTRERVKYNFLPGFGFGSFRHNGITAQDAGEVLSHRRRGAFIEDIPDGVHDSVAERVFKLIKTTGLEGDFVITGGVAHNSGVAASAGKRGRTRGSYSASAAIHRSAGSGLVGS